MEFENSEVSTMNSINEMEDQDSKFLNNFDSGIYEFVSEKIDHNRSINKHNFVEVAVVISEAYYVANYILQTNLLFPKSNDTFEEI
jgi:hypothetical protein